MTAGLFLVAAIFGIVVSVHAFGPKRSIGYVAFNILCGITFRAFNFFDSNFGHLHFNNKIFFTFCAGVIVLRHGSFLLKSFRSFPV